MQKETRKINDYTVLQKFHLGKIEYIIADNPAAPEGQRFLLTNVTFDGLFEKYDKNVVSDSYLDIVKEFTDRVGERAQELSKEHKEIGFDLKPLTIRDCKHMSYDKAIKDMVVVITPDVFYPEHQIITKQLYLCTGGFGSYAKSRGSACFCTSLYTGEEVRFEREDILGVIDKDDLPDWAKRGLENILDKGVEKVSQGRDDL